MGRKRLTTREKNASHKNPPWKKLATTVRANSAARGQEPQQISQIGNPPADKPIAVPLSQTGLQNPPADSAAPASDLIRHLLYHQRGEELDPNVIDLAIRHQPKLLRTRHDYRYAEGLMMRGKIRELKEFLAYRAKTAAENGEAFWLGLFRLARVPGRPRTRDDIDLKAAKLRSEKRLKWSQIAKQLCPVEFREDPRKCIDRIRSGARRAQERMNRPA